MLARRPAAWNFPMKGRIRRPLSCGRPCAVNHLEALCLKGRSIWNSQTAYWWLDYYREFKQHLESSCTEITRTADARRIYFFGQPGGLSEAFHRAMGREAPQNTNDGPEQALVPTFPPFSRRKGNAVRQRLGPGVFHRPAEHCRRYCGELFQVGRSSSHPALGRAEPVRPMKTWPP